MLGVRTMVVVLRCRSESIVSRDHGADVDAVTSHQYFRLLMAGQPAVVDTRRRRPIIHNQAEWRAVIQRRRIITMGVPEFDDNNFESEVLQANGPVLVDFWAPWCGPCRQIAPIVEQLASENTGAIKVGKLNVDEAPNSAQDYGVSSIPTLIFFKDGEVVERVVGVQPKSRLQATIDSIKGCKRRTPIAQSITNSTRCNEFVAPRFFARWLAHCRRRYRIAQHRQSTPATCCNGECCASSDLHSSGGNLGGLKWSLTVRLPMGIVASFVDSHRRCRHSLPRSSPPSGHYVCRVTTIHSHRPTRTIPPAPMRIDQPHCRGAVEPHAAVQRSAAASGQRASLSEAASHVSAGVEHSLEQLREHAAQLADRLQSEQGTLDRRESALAAKEADLEAKSREHARRGSVSVSRNSRSAPNRSPCASKNWPNAKRRPKLGRRS